MLIGIGDHLLRHVPLRLRIIVEAVLGNIDDDARVRAGGQDVPARNEYGFVGAGNPRIELGIDADQFLRAEAVLARQVVEGVLIDGLDALVLAEYALRRVGRARRSVATQGTLAAANSSAI